MKDGIIKVGAASPKIIVADIDHNEKSIIDTVLKADRIDVNVLCFPELCITGYTCGDLFLQTTLIDEAENALFDIASATLNSDVLFAVGLPMINCGKLYNCAAIVHHGEILAVIPKQNIPNYNEFYEMRHFVPYDGGCNTIQLCGRSYPFGKGIVLTCEDVKNLKIGVEICEDLWVASPPSSLLAQQGATVILNLSAGNEIIGKAERRTQIVAAHSSRLISGYVYCGAGESESTTDVVFSGHKFIYENGEMLNECKPFDFSNDMIVTEIDVDRLAFKRRCMTTFATDYNAQEVAFSFRTGTVTELTRNVDENPFLPGDMSKSFDAADQMLEIMAQGLIRRMEHTHCKALVLGISGGLDSCLALLACVRACNILGKPLETIHAVTMPCFGTTSHTKSNAQKLCELLKVSFREIDIKNSVTTHLNDIHHDENIKDAVYENAQARMRTMILMDLANAENGFVVGTGDMSELALGWATYNGDHMSSYAVNAGLPKTVVKYIVSAYASHTDDLKLREVLESIVATPISPELLPADDKGRIEQKTEDLVGPYELHDFFMFYMLKCGFSPRKIYRLAKHAFGGRFDNEVILKWLRTFLRRFFSQQFKRSCLPDGVKVLPIGLSPRGDLRMPSDASAKLWLAEVDTINVDD